MVRRVARYTAAQVIRIILRDNSDSEFEDSDICGDEEDHLSEQSDTEVRPI